MSVLTLNGTLSRGECGGVSSCGSASDTEIALGFGACSGRSSGASAHVPQRTVSSPGAFIALGEVGPSATVTQGDFLYLSANAPIEVRLTTDDGAGGTAVNVVRSDLVLLTFPAPYYLEFVEVRGSAQIEYLVSGPS